MAVAGAGRDQVRAVIVYQGPIEDHAVVQFLRREAPKLMALRKLVISPEKTAVLDVNGDGIEFPGLSYGSGTLEALLRELGVVFTAAVLHNRDATPTGVKEYPLSARWTWGHDRVM